MSSRLCITTKRAIGTTHRRSMLFHALECIMLNRTSLKKRSFSLSALVRCNRRKLSGGSWLQAAIGEWTYLTKHWRSMRTFMNTIRTILIAYEALFRLEKNSAWSTLSSVRSWWSWTERKKPSASMNTLRTSRATDTATWAADHRHL